MITVQILINGAVILSRSARNTGSVVDNANLSGPMSLSGECIYAVDDGSTIKHKRADGAVKLAKAMLDTIHES